MTEEAEEIKAEEIPLLTNVVVQTPTVDNWIQSAIDNKLDINILERLFAMKKEYDAQEAKKAFDEAMVLFQSECPTIKKTKRGAVTKENQTVFFYAPIEDIEMQTKELRAKHGFSYLIKTRFPENSGKVIASCETRHIRGHSEISEVEMPYLTRTGVMSEAQVVAGTITFAKRYAFCDAFGIMTMDDDSDGMTNEIILEDLEPLFQLIPDYCADYLTKLVSSIEKKSTFDKWKDTLPTIEQTNKMEELAEKIPTDKKEKYWMIFVKHSKKTVVKFLTDLENTLNKAKEK
jgi:hypothetical protein